MSDDIKKYYEEYGKKVYLYLLTLCRSPDTAEELTQETFYQAILSLKRFKGNCSVYTWLCSIAKNLWLKELDRMKKRPVAESNEDRPDLAPTPDETAELKDEKISLLRRIHSLPEQEKEIVLLRATGDLSFREIGEIFGKTENWARVTFYRAKLKIKEKDAKE